MHGEHARVRNFITVHMQQHPFIFSDQKKYRIGRHLLFWLAWYIFFAILYSYTGGISFYPDVDQLPVSLVNAFFFMVPHIFLSYSLMYGVIPWFIVKGRYFSAAGSVLVLFLLTAFISALIGVYILPVVRSYLFGFRFDLPNNFTFFMSLLGGLRGAITIGGLAAAIKLMKYWYLKEQRNLQLQKENIESRLQLLKAQVHPHFLFNTLNNIYSYTQDTSPVASRLVTGLSGMLRFILYECNQPLVPLSKELKMIGDYINLEKIRYGNKLELHLDLPKRTNDLYIAPLLLLPLVENSFKHGTSNMLEQPWINLKIGVEGNHMQLKLLNGKSNKQNPEKGEEGIGIPNVKKRLDLLYPGKHELTITSEEDVFIVNLRIELEKKEETVTKDISRKELSHA